MQPIDFRNATFAELRGHLVKKREAVWLDWQAYEIELQAAGKPLGATTREVCQRFGRDILQFRPRCTELFQMGVLKLADSQRSTPSPLNSREGAYVLRSMPEWEAWCAEQRDHATSGQQQLI